MNLSSWKPAFATERDEKPRPRNVDAQDLSAMQQEIERTKARLKLPPDAAA